jgi:hypothetical protein
MRSTDSAGDGRARAIAAAAATPDVEYSMFLLKDAMGFDLAPLEDLPEAEWLLHAGTETMVLHSAATDFRPAVRIEAWDRDPGAPSGSWDAVELARLAAPSGRVRLAPLDGEPSAEVIAPAPLLEVRVACRGRETVADAAHHGATRLDGLESWLIQLWPAAA